jgi:hypothetical protein
LQPNLRAFFDALAVPVQFNQKLITAFEEYEKHVSSK